MDKFQQACKVQLRYVWSMNIWYSFRHDVKRFATHNARYADLKQSARANKSRTNFIGFFLVDSRMMVKTNNYRKIVKTVSFIISYWLPSGLTLWSWAFI